jgi:uncharacterized protein (TIGR00369 family)
VIDPPPGFAPHFRKSPLTDAWEPLYSKREGEALTIGVRVAKPHTNARGMAHGGLIAALADNAMGLACALSGAGVGGIVTVSLTCDFTGTARIGDWLEIAATPVRVGRTLAFAEARVTVGERIIARASAVFSIPPAPSTPPVG